MKRLLWLFVLCLLLAGCEKEKTVEITESLVWETVPGVTYGVLESERLTLEPWYGGRAENVSQGTMAETELGYYWAVGSFLRYADKADLTNWVVVCNQPTCKHSLSWSYGDTECNASYIANVLIRSGRIYYTVTDSVPGTKGFGEVVVSRAPDGTDYRVEYYIEEQLFGDAEGGGVSVLTPTQCLTTASKLQPDGRLWNTVYRTTAAGTEKLSDWISDDPNLMLHFHLSTYGEEAFAAWHLDDTGKTLYRFRDGELEPLSVEKETGYLSGDTMRYFLTGEGYYDRNVITGERVFLAEPRLKNSTAFLLLPNCIVETNLYYNTLASGNGPGAIEIFDGQEWKKVALPPELEESTNIYTHSYVVTSNDIFFLAQEKPTPIQTVKDKGTYRLMGTVYRIDLTREEWTAELCKDLWTREN